MKQKRVTVGVIGYGYWGPNLVRNFFSSDLCVIKTVVDSNPERLHLIEKYFPSINTAESSQVLMTDPQIDAIVIATPVSTHFKLAKEALLSGKHVLVEKPMTKTLQEAEELIALAKKKKKILMVDHTFVYTDAVSKIKTIIDRGDIGKVLYFDSMRTNLGLFQSDVNVFSDLASHDIAILSYLLGQNPKTVQAIGVSHTKNKIENIGFLILKYSSGLVAHFNCSWSSPVKIRLILIGGDKKMIVYNDVEPSEKIKIYDTGYNITTLYHKSKILVDYRTGDIHIPKIELKEAVSALVEDFLTSIINKTVPKSDWRLGIKVMKILDLAQKSLKAHGRELSYK